jgi:hypothetical protein
MEPRRSVWARSLFTAAAVMLASSSLAAEVLVKAEDIAGSAIHYKVILPNGYNPAKGYPAVLAFPGGPQTMDTVDGTVERNWREQAERLGYIVIVPAAPNGRLFFEEGAKVFPEFLIKVLSAFHIAASYPQYFWSVTGLPGYLADANPARVRALAKLCINMYAGEMDTGWLESEKAQAAQFRAQGFIVEFSEEKGQGHVMRTLEGPGAARLFRQFEQARHGCGK